jgi:hypothetical protein
LRPLRLILGLAFATALAGAALSAVADEPRRAIDVSRAFDAGLPTVPDIVITKTPPDPQAMVERSQWVFDLRWDRGDVYLVGIPLLGAEEPDAALSFTPKLRTRIGVVFPASKRGTRLELVDRATRKRWALPWPVEGEPVVAADAAPG